KALWSFRTNLEGRATFTGRTYASDGRPFYEWHQLPKDVRSHPWCLTFAYVVTHNHFTLSLTDMAFKQSAPIVKLAEDNTEQDHLNFLGLLNSSTACCL